jgi:CheY-like chemotaxis protein
MRILVIDDDVVVARSIERMLRGDQVVVEDDGARGVARVESAARDGQPFDVVLCDFHLPVTTGPQIFAQLRDRGDPPITVLITGDVVADTSNADGMLVKPFRSHELRSLISALLETRSRATTRRLQRAR